MNVMFFSDDIHMVILLANKPFFTDYQMTKVSYHINVYKWMSYFSREHKKMLMHMEDLQNRMKDIQFMKVTREIQLVRFCWF